MAEWEKSAIVPIASASSIRHELHDQAHERLTAAIEATAETRAITMEGLRCKARASAKI
jgi:hypothetical protein